MKKQARFKWTFLQVRYPNYQWKSSTLLLVISEMKSLSRVRLFETPGKVAYQALPPMGFSRQEYWSGLPFPSPGNLPNPGIKPGSPALQTDALLSEPPGKPYYSLVKCKSKLQGGTPLVVQCLGICLSVQETAVRFLVWADLACHGATKPVCHNYGSWHALGPADHS